MGMQLLAIEVFKRLGSKQSYVLMASLIALVASIFWLAQSHYNSCSLGLSLV